jgi:hypothetical protein
MKGLEAAALGGAAADDGAAAKIRRSGVGAMLGLAPAPGLRVKKRSQRQLEAVEEEGGDVPEALLPPIRAASRSEGAATALAGARGRRLSVAVVQRNATSMSLRSEGSWSAPEDVARGSGGSPGGSLNLTTSFQNPFEVREDWLEEQSRLGLREWMHNPSGLRLKRRGGPHLSPSPAP